MALVGFSLLYVSIHIFSSAWTKSNSSDLSVLSQTEALAISNTISTRIQKAELISLLLNGSSNVSPAIEGEINSHLFGRRTFGTDKGMFVTDGDGTVVYSAPATSLSPRFMRVSREATLELGRRMYEKGDSAFVASLDSENYMVVVVPRRSQGSKYAGAVGLIVDVSRALSGVRIRTGSIYGCSVVIYDSTGKQLSKAEGNSPRLSRRDLAGLFSTYKIGSRIQELDGTIHSVAEIPWLNWYVTATEPLSNLTGDVKKLEMYGAGLGAVGLIFALVLSFFVSSVATKPLTGLTRAVSSVGEMNGVAVTPAGTKELRALIVTFNEMRARIERDIQELQKLNRLGRLVLTNITTESFMDRIADAVCDLMSAEKCRIFTFDSTDGNLVLRGISGGDDKKRGMHFSVDSGLTGRIFRTAEPVFTNAYREQEYVHEAGVKGGARNFIGAPLLDGGKVTGVVAAINGAEGKAWNDRDLQLLSALTNEIAVAIQNHLLVERLDSELSRVKQLQAELVQSEKLATLGQLISGIAHELNNPLGVVMGFSEMAVRQNVEPRIAGYLEKVYQSAKRASAVVQNFLKFARKHETALGNVRLNDVAESVIRLMEHQFKVQGVAISLDSEAGLPEVMGDFQELQQVFVNLLTNALQSLEGREKGSVSIRLACSAGNVFATVTDNGAGIPENIIGRIFDPFFTTKPIGKGTGLGLSMCYEIIKEHHNGSIKVVSEYGKGTTFKILIPSAPKSVGELRDGMILEDSGLIRGRVLVVDDEEMMRQLIAEALHSAGCEVVVAEDGINALEKLAAFQPDVVLSDLLMPGMNGRELYERSIAVSDRYAGRFIFITGDTASEGFRDFLVQSNAEVVTKPFDVANLTSLIGRKISEVEQKRGV